MVTSQFTTVVACERSTGGHVRRISLRRLLLQLVVVSVKGSQLRFDFSAIDVKVRQRRVDLAQRELPVTLHNVLGVLTLDVEHGDHGVARRTLAAVHEYLLGCW